MNHENTSPKPGYLDLHGPALASFGSSLPQFTEDPDIAQVLISYTDLDFMTAQPMRVYFERGANDVDVERVAEQAGIVFDPSAESHAQRVATDGNLRAALIKEGFDAFAGLSVLENQEPFQVVVFDASRAKPVALAKAEEQRAKIESALPKRSKPGPKARTL